jgi:hypothetical protein
MKLLSKISMGLKDHWISIAKVQLEVVWMRQIGSPYTRVGAGKNDPTCWVNVSMLWTLALFVITSQP